MDDIKTFEPFLLTPWDSSMPGISQCYFLSFRSENPESCLLPIQTGITNLISSLPFLAGDITASSKLEGKRDVLEIRASSASLNKIPMIQVKHHPNQLLPVRENRRDPKNTDTDANVAVLDDSYSPLPALAPSTTHWPVLRFQANVLLDGIVLCICFDHRVFDGVGAGTVVEILAECCRGVPTGATPLHLKCQNEAELRHSLSTHGVAQLRGNENSEGSSLTELMSGNSQEDISELSAPILATRSFAFPSQTIRYLKDICNSLLPSSLHANDREKISASSRDHLQFVSSNDVLSALLGVCINRARNRKESNLSENPDLAVAVNCRGRFSPPMPDFYLGNAVTAVRVYLNSPDVALELPETGPETMSYPPFDNECTTRIAKLAFQIRVKLDSIDDGYIRGIISYLQNMNGRDKIGLRLPDTTLSSWRHLKVYCLDFGTNLGRVACFNMQSGLSDGICVIMPTRPVTAEGGTGIAPWDVDITLKQEDMTSLIEDDLFRSALEAHTHLNNGHGEIS